MKKNRDPEVFRRNMTEFGSFLWEIIDLDNGLLDTLLNKRVLTQEQFGEMQTTLYDKNDKLLDFLVRHYEGDYSEVFDALVETGQEHIVNFICSCGSKFNILF